MGPRHESADRGCRRRATKLRDHVGRSAHLELRSTQRSGHGGRCPGPGRGWQRQRLREYRLLFDGKPGQRERRGGTVQQFDRCGNRLGGLERANGDECDGAGSGEQTE